MGEQPERVRTTNGGMTMYIGEKRFDCNNGVVQNQIADAIVSEIAKAVAAEREKFSELANDVGGLFAEFALQHPTAFSWTCWCSMIDEKCLYCRVGEYREMRKGGEDGQR